MRHTKNGDCPRCNQIIDRYPGISLSLRAWFKEMQANHPEMHTSCAGRGRQDQEECFLKGASRAQFGDSAHNCNAAIDIFEMQGDRANIYEREWFDRVIAPAVKEAKFLKWYGAPGSVFEELPHIEVANWRELLKAGELKLVE